MNGVTAEASLSRIPRERILRPVGFFRILKEHRGRMAAAPPYPAGIPSWLQISCTIRVRGARRGRSLSSPHIGAARRKTSIRTGFWSAEYRLSRSSSPVSRKTSNGPERRLSAWASTVATSGQASIRSAARFRVAVVRPEPATYRANRSGVTVTGAGGVGKTRVGLHVASLLLEAHPSGVWTVELAPLEDPALVAARIARTLEIAPPSNAVGAALRRTRFRRVKTDPPGREVCEVGPGFLGPCRAGDSSRP